MKDKKTTKTEKKDIKEEVIEKKEPIFKPMAKFGASKNFNSQKSQSFDRRPVNVVRHKG